MSHHIEHKPAARPDCDDSTRAAIDAAMAARADDMRRQQEVTRLNPQVSG